MCNKTSNMSYVFFCIQSTYQPGDFQWNKTIEEQKKFGLLLYV